MNLGTLRATLRKTPDKALAIVLPDRVELPAHFHITEVGRVTKDFVDCGGTRRKTDSCVLQTLVANDTDHRIHAEKLAGILEKGAEIGLSDELEVEAEVQGTTIQIFSVAQIIEADDVLRLQLESKSTACLAPDKCGLDALPVLGNEGACCGGDTDCC